MDIPAPQLAQLQEFIRLVKQQPDILHDKKFSFFREYLESLGARIPEKKTKPSSAPVEEDDIPDLEEEPEMPQQEPEPQPEPEPEPEPEDPDVIKPESDAPQPMGDEAMEVTDDMRDKAQELRSQASELLASGEFDKAIDALNEAITKNNGRSAPLYASRGLAFLKAKKPMSAIRDAEAAMRINPDSAAAFKVRGRARALIGEWESAVADLKAANQRDYDPDVYEQIKVLEPKATAAAARKKAREDREKARSKPKPSTAGGTGAGAKKGGMPNWIPENVMQTLMSDPDFLEAIQDPTLLPIITEISSDPSKIAKYKDHPKLNKLFSKFGSTFGQ